jgi:hypothetical protein
MGRRHRALGFLVAVLLSPGVSFGASSEATLVGKVIDGNGEPLPGVTLLLRNDSLAYQEHGALTDAKGEFRFPHLPPGSGYQLTVSLPTFGSLVFSDISLQPGETLT